MERKILAWVLVLFVTSGVYGNGIRFGPYIGSEIFQTTVGIRNVSASSALYNTGVGLAAMSLPKAGAFGWSAQAGFSFNWVSLIQASDDKQSVSFDADWQQHVIHTEALFLYGIAKSLYVGSGPAFAMALPGSFSGNESQDSEYNSYGLTATAGVFLKPVVLHFDFSFYPLITGPGIENVPDDVFLHSFGMRIGIKTVF